MSKPRSERSRWVTILTIGRPGPNEQGGKEGHAKHNEAHAVVEAFQRVGRVVRVEVQYQALVFKARRA